MAEPPADRGVILRAAISICLYAMAFGASFGAISIGSGLTVAQTMVLSLVMFTGASQFAFVGVLASGGSPFAAVSAGLLLGVRNAFYGVPISEILHPRGLARVWTAHFVIERVNRDGRRSSDAAGAMLCILGDRADLVHAMATGQPNRGADRPSDRPICSRT
jgi:hypothetical protein